MYHPKKVPLIQASIKDNKSSIDFDQGINIHPPCVTSQIKIRLNRPDLICVLNYGVQVRVKPILEATKQQNGLINLLVLSLLVGAH